MALPPRLTLNPRILFPPPVEAATRIQAVFRGHKVRATRMKPGDTDSPTKDTAESTGPAGGHDESTQAAKTPTKEDLAAEFDPNDKGKANHAFPPPFPWTQGKWPEGQGTKGSSWGEGDRPIAW